MTYNNKKKSLPCMITETPWRRKKRRMRNITRITPPRRQRGMGKNFSV
jgi:hypothetical protein